MTARSERPSDLAAALRRSVESFRAEHPLSETVVAKLDGLQAEAPGSSLYVMSNGTTVALVCNDCGTVVVEFLADHIKLDILNARAAEHPDCPEHEDAQ